MAAVRDSHNVRWTVRREKVKGWNGSRQRMTAILDEVRAGGSPEVESGAKVY